MQEPHIEGLANHDDPKPCAGAQEGPGEASVGAHAGSGQDNRETSTSRVPTISEQSEGHTAMRATASARRTRRGHGAGHVWKLSAREPGEPSFAQGSGGALGRVGKAQATSR